MKTLKLVPTTGRLVLTVALALSIAAGTSSLAHAQTPPGTDIHLVAITTTSNGPRVGAAKPVTDREGYDNQPYFIDHGAALVYTSIDAEGQADIRRYTLATGADVAITDTAESEYSPTPTPDGGLSVVRVEPDQKQRLWRFPLPGEKTEAMLLLPEVEPVGYHAWIDDRRLMLFVLGEPPTLQIVTLGGGAPTVIAENIGRALAAIPKRDMMSFVHKVSADSWWVTALDPKTGKLERLIETRPQREDFAWAPDGSLWMGDGNQLFQWRPAQDTSWRMVVELPIDDISRLAFNPQGDALALVATRSPAQPDTGPEPEQR